MWNPWSFNRMYSKVGQIVVRVLTYDEYYFTNIEYNFKIIVFLGFGILVFIIFLFSSFKMEIASKMFFPNLFLICEHGVASLKQF